MKTKIMKVLAAIIAWQLMSAIIAVGATVFDGGNFWINHLYAMGVIVGATIFASLGFGFIFFILDEEVRD